MLLLVTGLPSPGKNRLVDALGRRFGAHQIVAGWLPGAHADAVLHVHAESDLEALVEGGWRPSSARDGARMVVRVDWEPVAESVERIARTLGAEAAGAGSR